MKQKIRAGFNTAGLRGKGIHATFLPDAATAPFDRRMRLQAGQLRHDSFLRCQEYFFVNARILIKLFRLLFA